MPRKQASRSDTARAISHIIVLVCVHSLMPTRRPFCMNPNFDIDDTGTSRTDEPNIVAKLTHLLLATAKWHPAVTAPLKASLGTFNDFSERC
jgi:hypothetical protein